MWAGTLTPATWSACICEFRRISRGASAQVLVPFPSFKGITPSVIHVAPWFRDSQKGPVNLNSWHGAQTWCAQCHLGACAGIGSSQRNFRDRRCRTALFICYDWDYTRPFNVCPCSAPWDISTLWSFVGMDDPSRLTFSKLYIFWTVGWTAFAKVQSLHEFRAIASFAICPL